MMICLAPKELAAPIASLVPRELIQTIMGFMLQVNAKIAQLEIIAFLVQVGQLALQERIIPIVGDLLLQGTEVFDHQDLDFLVNINWLFYDYFL
jgi:hypothetical protein